MKLSSKSCEACLSQAVKLNQDEIKEFLRQINSWSLSYDEKWVYKEFKFKNFQQSLDFVNKVGEIAESEYHHPNFDFTWGYCKISIQTHKVDGLCEADFILAAKIDEIS